MKMSHRADNLWLKLRGLISRIDEHKTYELLEAVKQWVEENKRILTPEFAKGRPVLCLLLEGKAAQFAIARPLEAAQQLKYLVLSLPIPKTVEVMADRLEAAISEFAIFTESQECPICHEGFLGYWIEPRTKTFVLRCPECSWEQDISGKKWVEPLPLLPATVQDIKMQSILLDENNP